MLHIGSSVECYGGLNRSFFPCDDPSDISYWHPSTKLALRMYISKTKTFGLCK